MNILLAQTSEPGAFAEMPPPDLAPYTEPASSFPWSTIVVLALILAGVGIAWWRGWRPPNLAARLRYNFTSVDGQDDPLEAEVRTSGFDKGAPRRKPRGGPRGGWDWEMIEQRFEQHPDFLRDHIQAALDQRDGLERLRTTLEDSDFEYGEPGRDGKPDTIVKVKIVAMTDKQFSNLPTTLAKDILSRRSRPVMAVMSGGGNGNGAHEEPPRAAGSRERRKRPSLAPDDEPSFFDGSASGEVEE